VKTTVVQPVNFNPAQMGPVEAVQQAQRQAIQQQASQAASGAVQPFDAVMQSAVEKGFGLKFSAHARERLQMRNIQLSAADLSRLSNAVDKAAAKGARESLLVMNDVAMIVSVTNRTVITALAGANMRENVFTNIDSAVIV
jgi:flagellar operon protein